MHQLLLGVIALGLGGFASAQDIELFQPRSTEVDPTASAPTVTSREELKEAGEISSESVGTIHGIRLLSKPGQVNVDNPPATSGVQIGDTTLVVPDGVISAIEPFIGGPLSLKSIDDISRAAVLAYRDAGLPVVDLGFPEQNVSTGVLQLIVIVGRAGEISVEGNRYFDDQVYLRSFRTAPGEVLWEGPILADLNYINRNPYRRVNMVYTPGAGFGEADIILQANDKRPYAAYFGYENTGNEFLGEDRLLFGAEWGDALGLDHIFGYQYTTTTDFDSLQAHSATYRIPIWQLRHELRLLGAYVTSDGSIGAGTGQTLASGGESSQLSAYYLIPGPSFLGYTHDIELGFDHKSTNNNLEFGGTQVFNNTAEIYQFSIGQQLYKNQSFGHQSISHRVVYSPGELSNHNSAAEFNAIRAGATPDYAYWNGGFQQIVNLPQGFTFLFDAEAQLSDSNLLPSETLILGGVNSVRGFEQNLLRGDKGVRTTVELYAPPVSPLQLVAPKLDGVRDSARIFGFYDQAWAGNIDLLPGEPSSLQLGGLGLGLDYQLNESFSTRISHGWQVDEQGFTDTEDSRWQIFGTIRY